MDMDDAEKFELLSEQQVKQRRARNKKLALFLIVPFLLLVVYGSWAIGSGVNDATATGWRQNLFKTRSEHAERQTSGREQYLVGVGKADITG